MVQRSSSPCKKNFGASYELTHVEQLYLPHTSNDCSGGLLARNTDKEGMTREGRQHSGVSIILWYHIM